MEFDQEKYLDEATKVIKVQAYHLNKMIDNNNLKQALKESAVMLAELKTSLLTPRNYYSIFTLVLDELQFLEQFFKEENRRGRRMKHLYDSVQQAQSIIPRLYLMITAGRIYIEAGEISAKRLLFELLNAIKGVQNPTRGLFLRYYFLKTMKDKLPDTPEDVDISLKFILQNLEEMNRLWIRLSTGCTGNEKLLREKERNELKVLVGENIIRISDLNSLTLEKYQTEVLPKIINILLESKDSLSQQYILECIIHAFTETFNISCMSLILDTLTKVVGSVDIKSLFINLMEKLSRFIGDEQQRSQEVQSTDDGYDDGKGKFDVQVEVEKIFGILKDNIDKLVEENKNSENPDDLKIIELEVAFMKFTLKCCPPNRKVDTINHITKSVLQILSTSMTSKLSKDTVKQALRILTLPLENKISVFKVTLFSELMAYLDYKSRSQLALNILENISQVSKKKGFISDEVSHNEPEKIDEDDVLNSADKINSLLSYIKPLTEKSSDSYELDKIQFNYEQLAVSKLIFAIKEKNPEKYYSMLKIVQNVFVKGGDERIKFTIPNLVNLYLNLISNSYLAFFSKNNEEMIKDKPAYHINYISNVDCSCFSSKEDLTVFCNNIYENIMNLINSSLAEYNLTLQLLINVLFNINFCKELGNGDLAFKITNQIIDYLKEIKNDQSEKKLQLFVLLVNSLLSIKCLSEENYNDVVGKINNLTSSFVKRYEQSKAMLSVSDLYYHEFYPKQEEKCKEALSKSAEFADYAMSTNTQACLNLYILLINKNIYFLQKGASFIVAKRINKLIEKVNNCIKSIKAENQSVDGLKEIEVFFLNTIQLVKTRKNNSELKIYQDITTSVDSEE